MATYGHTLPGPALAVNKVIVKDILANGTAAVVEIQQPKNSIVENVYVRILDDITVAGDVDIAFQMGATNSSADIVAAAATGILEGGDALTVSAGNVFKYDAVAGTAGPSTTGVTDGAGSYQTTARTLYAQFTTGAAAVSAQGGIELSCVYRIFE